MRKAITVAVILTLAVLWVGAGVGYLKQERAKIDAELVKPYQVQIDQKDAQLNDLQKALQESQAQEEELKKQVQEKDQALLSKAKAKEEAQALAVMLPKPKIIPVSQVSSDAQSKPEATDGDPLHGFQVTWYNDEGTTASGKPTQDGLTVSVDRRVIPLGTKLKIVMPDGEVYFRTAQDTGGAVKGKIIDIYAKQPTSELNRRGRTYGVTVYILG